MRRGRTARRAGLLAPCLLLATIGTLAAQTASLPAPHAAPGRDELTRGAVVAVLPRLTELAAAAVSDGTVPGLAIAVVFRDEVICLEGFGTSEVGELRPVGADTVFPLASLSKPVAATVVAALVGDDVVGWDVPVAALDRSLRFHDPDVAEEVTLRDLLSHRSGLAATAGADLELIGDRQGEILERIPLLPAGGGLRAGFAYSNYGFTLAALAAAQAAGEAWEDLSAARLFRPAEMTRTSFRLADYRDAVDRVALHTQVDGQWHATPEDAVVAESVPASAASSTARDLASWMRLVLGEGMLEGRGIVDATALAETQYPLVPSGSDPDGVASFYGIGWEIGTDEHGRHVAHNGAFTSGVSTLVDLMPDQEIGIVVLANAFPSGVPQGLAASFYDLVHEGQLAGDRIGTFDAMLAEHHTRFVAAISGPLGLPVAPVAEPLPLASYVGRYANEYVGDAIVAMNGEALELVLGPDGSKRYALLHHNRDVFYFSPLIESPDILLPVTFTIGPDGRASHVSFGYIGGSSHDRLGRIPD